VLKALGRLLWHVFVLAFLVGLGVLMANVLMIVPPVRKALNVPPDAPNLFAHWVDMTGEGNLAQIEHELESAGQEPTPSEHAVPAATGGRTPAASPAVSPTPFHRMSWEELEKGPPKNPAARSHGIVVLRAA
jgi:hypothetical protein